MGAIGDTSVIPILEEYSKDTVVEVAETCELALKRLQWIKNALANEQNLSENPYASVDPAPPAETKNLDELTKILLNESAPLFERYRAMFSLRNLQTKESILALSKGWFNFLFFFNKVFNKIFISFFFLFKD